MLSQSFLPFLIGRSLTGISGGMNYVICSIFCKEFSPIELRGLISSFVIISQNLGGTMVNSLNIGKYLIF